MLTQKSKQTKYYSVCFIVGSSKFGTMNSTALYRVSYSLIKGQLQNKTVLAALNLKN